MKVVYSPDADVVTARARKVDVVSKPITRSHAVEGVALINATFSSVTIEASVDDFASTVYATTLNNVAGNLLVEPGSAIAAAKWRVSGFGSLGVLLPGKLFNLFPPTYPYGWADNVVGEDRTTLGGVGYSRVRYTGKKAPWEFEIANDEIDDWKSWYKETKGFRLPSAITDPEKEEVFLVRAPSSTFPLQRQNFGLWTGSLDMREVL